MRITPGYSVGMAALFLAGAVACDGDGPSSGTGPPPPGGGDTVAPQTVSDLALTYRPATRDVEFAWTAPRDDDASDRVARYDIRYSYSFPLDWDLSVSVSDPPAPEPVGNAQTYALAGAQRGRDIYAAARTRDAAGNLSPIGPVTHLYIPGIRFEAVCEDVFARSPVEGLDAIVTASASWNLTTDASGTIVIDNVTGGTLGIRIDTGTATSTYHRFQRTLAVDDDLFMPIPMIPVVAADSPLYENTLQILLDALVVAGSNQVLKRWHTYPIPWYAAAYVNGNGLDYADLTRQAAAQWNARTGLEIFVEVPAVPASGIHVQFLSRAAMGIQNGITEHENDPEGYPVGETIKIVNDFSDPAKLYTILMHEFGHTIRLNHLPAGFIMYAGQPLPADITDDEVRVVQMMLAIPNGTDLALYTSSSSP